MNTRSYMPLLICPLFIWAAALFVPAAAVAQTRADQAKELYERGTAEYARGDYRAAARSLRQAYDLSQRPALLYNIGMAEWRGGEGGRARETFQRALRLELPGTLRPQTQARLTAFDRIATAQKTSERVTTVAPTPDPPAKSVGWRGVAGGGLTAAGAGLLTAAGIVSLQIGQNEDDLRAAAASSDAERLEETRGRIDQLQRIGPPMLYAGAVLAVAGASLLVWEVTRRREDAPSVDVVVMQTGFGPAVRVRY